MLEPEIVRLAGARMTPAELDSLLELGETPRGGRDDGTDRGHELSREFHIRLAHGTGQPRVRAHPRIPLDWRGRAPARGSGRRGSPEEWQAGDAEEHRAIATALQAGDVERAADLMARHLESTHEYWTKVCKETVSA